MNSLRAKSGKRVLLIDGNYHPPTSASFLNMPDLRVEKTTISHPRKYSKFALFPWLTEYPECLLVQLSISRVFQHVDKDDHLTSNPKLPVIPKA